MSLTVGIPNRNKADHLQKCIDSALQFADEVLVIDNASTDGSTDIIRASNVDEAVLLGTDQGYIASLNELIDMAKCDRLMLLDSDDWLIADPHRLDQGDWCVAPLYVCDDSDAIRDVWTIANATNFCDATAYCRFALTNPLSVKASLRVAWLRDNGLRFEALPNCPDYGEDTYTALQWLRCAPKVVIEHGPVYVYRWLGRAATDERPARFSAALSDYLRGIA
jgi:glycosyltransferase involved in cell wall biosynthesis